MSKIISDTDQYEAGRAAFLADDDHLLFNCTEDFLEGYKEAFFEHAPKSQMDPHGENVEEYWKAHYSEAVSGMANRLLTAIGEKPRRKAARANLVHGVVTHVLGIAIAVVLTLIVLAPFLMDESEVRAFWKEVF